MALPQDGQNANSLARVTKIPTGKELIFIDPDTSEGGIISIEDITKQILDNLVNQSFTLKQGEMTLIQAINQINDEITALK